jgi:uncharacterized protein YigA (DUF484 family)
VPTDADAVAAYLRANPGFLAEHPGLYAVLAPPARIHGDILADHMAAMIQAGRRHAARMEAQAGDVVAAGRAAAGLACRVQEAVLALMQAADPLDCITAELPGLLAVDAVALCTEGLPTPGARTLPPGSVEALLGTRAALVRTAPDDAGLLHGEAAPLAARDALVRIPGAGPPALLALAARSPAVLDPASGAAPLAFLGRAVAAALRR